MNNNRLNLGLGNDIKNGLKFPGATAPAVGGEADTTRVSPRYRHISTTEVLASFERRGWVPTMSAQRGRRGVFTTHSTHIVEMENPTLTAQVCGNTAEVGGLEPRIYIKNSHDGTSSLTVQFGFLRLVCLNGLAVGERLGSFRVRHYGDGIDELELKLAAVAETFGKIISKIQELRGTEATYATKMNLALKGLALKYGDDAVAELNKRGYLTKVLEEISTPQRSEDSRDNLWEVFNRIQEQMVMAVSRMPSDVPGFKRTRKISSKERAISVTSQLFDFTLELAAQAA